MAHAAPGWLAFARFGSSAGSTRSRQTWKVETVFCWKSSAGVSSTMNCKPMVEKAMGSCSPGQGRPPPPRATRGQGTFYFFTYLARTGHFVSQACKCPWLYNAHFLQRVSCSGRRRLTLQSLWDQAGPLVHLVIVFVHYFSKTKFK